MSRHRLVKNLDLDNELDDFEGGKDYDDTEEEISEADKEHLRAGTLEVKEMLGDAANQVSEKEIQDSLWHYYYDIEKTVNYLLGVAERRNKVEQKKKKTGCLSGSETALSFAKFSGDSTLFNIPVERQSILVAPMTPTERPQSGPLEEKPKMSKLQVLAASRKKKAQEQKAGSMELISKDVKGLTINGKEDAVRKQIPERQDVSMEPNTAKQPARGFPFRKRKDSNPHEKSPKAPSPRPKKPEAQEDMPMEVPVVMKAEPSAFANTMFSSTACLTDTASLFTMLYVAKPTNTADPFSGPSPDDIVIAAQSKASSNKGGKGPPKTNGEKKADQIANGIEAMKLDNTPRATSKNLEVLKEYEKAEKKNEANFVVIGHVDAGKSTMMGRLLYDLDVVDQRTIDRYRKDAEKMGKSSFALAWVLDQGTEERSRGVTIDIAMNKFATSKTKFIILDAPGHKDFVPNMIAGAAQADFAVLVIDASTGSFESGLQGQTKEHALLVRSMGVQRIIVAVNKLDTINWSQDRFDEISQQTSAFLLSANFQKKNITFIPCSGLQGDNIVRKSTEAVFTSWYTGPTLVEELDNSEPVLRALEKPLRMTIADIFRGGVQNPLSVSGRLDAGSLQTGDALLAQPSGEKCYIKSIDLDEQPVPWAVAGQHITLHLADIDPIHLKIGDVLSSPASPIKNAESFTAKILAFGFLMPMKVDVHRGRVHVPGRVKRLVGTLDKTTGDLVKGKKPRVVKPGMVARVVVDLDAQVPLESGMRVVLRDEGETVGSGVVE
ncbi:P-loop containing nucleoside triphosphate hydrolase protein [Calycina marina]|uniref:Elongation factor 1 alpha-like protein n=1 Tax=Calycina marina TaxID=1763456 RepID=A0A9P7Z7L5_9HELO|nr:P-loop containing nucleoside triphosphate hydrolase protein [Calycina marina]